MDPLTFERRRQKAKNCPCGKSNEDGKFVPYVGFEDKGFCHSCGGTFFPVIEEKVKDRQKSFTPPPKTVSFIDPHYLQASLTGYDQNNFVLFLTNTFGESKAMEAVEAYKIGTSKRWPGATVFWQIDHKNQIRSGKIMLYDASTGKRQPKNSWVHSVLKLEEFNLNQCLFGSHLIGSDLGKNIALVESEKTAIIASLLFPDFIWMASGGKDGLRPEKCQILSKRTVYLFPDLTKPEDKVNCFELWIEKAKILSNEIPGAFFHVSHYLETRASNEEKRQGLDIADYILKWENEGNEENEASTKQNKNDQSEIDQPGDIESRIKERRNETFKIWGKIKLVRNQIENLRIFEAKERTNRELLKRYRESLKE